MSLILGLCAALAWGIHDICVRYISQSGGILVSLTIVLVGGCFVLLPVNIFFADWSEMTSQSTWYAVLSGTIYLFGCIGLYKAFAIGPVRLVAPIIGAYPILSFLWAGLTGQAVKWEHWVAVGFVIFGVALVGLLSRSEDSQSNTIAAVLWAILGAFGFASAFAIGHIATQAGAELPVILVSRMAAASGAVMLLLWKVGLYIPDRSTWPFLAAMAGLDTTAHSIVVGAGNLDRPEFAAVAASMFGMVTVALAWMFLKEEITWGQWCGVALAFASIGYLAL
jgi:drug/metabolite transporter (DMT)-like permease